MVKVAVVQEAPVLLNKQKTLELVVDRISQAAAQGAKLVVFTEAFISGYPAWIWRLRPGGDWGTSETLHRQLLENSIDLGTNDLSPLMQAAREHELTLVCGMNERDNSLSRSTVFNSAVTIGPDGAILNRHKKLMPTNPERMVWGFGDASGLKVVESPVGRLGTLICWENYMPLARFALYAQGVEIHVAPTYDSGEGWLESMRHIAREGRCWVINSGVALQGDDIPADFPEKDSIYPNTDEWINPGDSAVIAPGGEMVAGPMHESKGILYAEVDPALVAPARRALDVAGHYSRPDIFSLNVNQSEQKPCKFSPE